MPRHPCQAGQSSPVQHHLLKGQALQPRKVLRQQRQRTEAAAAAAAAVADRAQVQSPQREPPEAAEVVQCWQHWPWQQHWQSRLLDSLAAVSILASAAAAAAVVGVD
jgi:hypothetical protein